MIVVEKHGKRLRCTGCHAKFDMTRYGDTHAVREGFAEYHTLCPLAGSVQAAQEMIRSRVRSAMRAQIQHRQKFERQSMTGATG